MDGSGDENWLREMLSAKLRVFNNLTRNQLVTKTPLEIQSMIGDSRLEELLLQNITYSPEKRSELTELIRQWNPNVSQPQTNPLEQFDSLLDSLSSNSEAEHPPSIEQLPSPPQLPSDPLLLNPEPEPEPVPLVEVTSQVQSQPLDNQVQSPMSGFSNNIGEHWDELSNNPESRTQYTTAFYLNCTTLGLISTKEPLLLPGEKLVLIKEKARAICRASASNRSTKVNVYISQYRLLLVEAKSLTISSMLFYPTMTSIWMNLDSSFSPYNSLKWEVTDKLRILPWEGFGLWQKQVRLHQPDSNLVLSYQNVVNEREQRKFFKKKWKLTNKKDFIMIRKCSQLYDQLLSTQFHPISTEMLLGHISESHTNDDVREAHGLYSL